jgi:hypothetical protein
LPSENRSSFTSIAHQAVVRKRNSTNGASLCSGAKAHLTFEGRAYRTTPSHRWFTRLA